MSFRHVTTATVAAIAAATVLSACGSSVSGEAASTSTTTGESFTLKAATETGVAPKLAGPGPVGELQDVTGRGDVRRSPRDNARWAPSPEPGALVSTADYGCTLGPAITKAGRTGFLIAEHCVKTGTQWARVNPQAANPLALGPAVEGNKPTDSAVIWTEAAADDTRVAGTWPIRGALTLPQVQALNVSSKVCINGAVSGVLCGSVASSSNDTMFLILPTHEGDSGSAVFVVDERGDAWIAGVLVRGNSGNRSDATPISTALAGRNAEVITA